MQIDFIKANKIVEDSKFVFGLRHNVLFAKKMDELSEILAKCEAEISNSESQ